MDDGIKRSKRRERQLLREKMKQKGIISDKKASKPKTKSKTKGVELVEEHDNFNVYEVSKAEAANMDLLAISQAGDELGYKSSYAYKLSSMFGLDKYKLGREVFYKREDIEELKKEPHMQRRVEKAKQANTKNLNISFSDEEQKKYAAAKTLLELNDIDLDEHIKNIIVEELEEIVTYTKD